jgi:predicted PurR-regulated permease PerM
MRDEDSTSATPAAPIARAALSGTATGSGIGSVPPTSESNRSSLKMTDLELPRIHLAPATKEIEHTRRRSLQVLLLVAFVAVAWLVSPIWVGIALGTTMAFTVQPSYRRLSRRLDDRRHVAAALLTLLAGIFCLVGGGLALYVVSAEIFDIAGVLQRRLQHGSLDELFGHSAVGVLDQLHVDRGGLLGHIRDGVSAAENRATNSVGAILQAGTDASFGLVIALLTMYYVLLEWPTIALRLERTLPLDPRHTRALMLEFRDVGRTALIGTLATAIVQGALAWIGFSLSGVPEPLTWAFVTALASFVPLIGTSVVWGPMAIYLVSRGEVAQACLELAWGVFIVMMLADYVIRPRIVGSGGHGHPLLMLLSLLGGIEVFGLAGLIVGPIVMALFLAVLRIYERESARLERLRTLPGTAPVMTPRP